MENVIKEGRTRREFLKGAGAVVAGGVVVGVVGSQLSCEEVPGAVGVAAANAYLVHDSHKCATCLTCVLTCATVHEGKANLSLGRLQRVGNSFGHFPGDVKLMDCRQCVYVPCIDACPSGAFYVDADNGNTRTVDEAKCAEYQESIAPDVCQLCIEACPYVPAIAVWNHEYGQGIDGVAMVCDLCNDAPYWSEEGGVDGKQACVEACPMRAIKLVKEEPSQLDTEGYDVNLRNEHWAWLGF